MSLKKYYRKTKFHSSGYGSSRSIRSKMRHFGHWLRETFAFRKGRPIYLTPTFWVIIGGIALTVILVLSLVVLPEIEAQKNLEQAQIISEQTQQAKEEAMNNMNISEGYEGDEIPQLQERLAELGYLEVDETTNLYGPATVEAVKRFQILAGLESNGIVTKEVWDALFSAVAPKSVVTVGMQGDDIADYQTRLNNLGYLDSDSTGFYGDDTAQAVYDFQVKNWLTSTGTIDLATSEKLYASDVVPKFWGYGMQGDTVKVIQERLINLGYLSGAADGDYGERTTVAVKLFQKKNGLVVDGYLGNQTYSMLMSDAAQPNAYTVGDEGEAVTLLQDKLVNLNYINKSTGYFGSDTKEAVQKFQSANGLDADGKAGPMTLAMMYSDDVVYGKEPVRVGHNSAVEAFINAAAEKLGCKYVLGAKGPNRFDCSGLVYWALNHAGVSQGYITSTTWRNYGSYKTIKDIDDVRAGDVICFKPHHVGIAISDNMMIDASTNNGKVVKRSFRTGYFERNFVCARRIF